MPWDITGTSTTPVPQELPTHRIERRIFAKRSRVIVRSGFSYLSRGDFYNNPGISADVAYYPEEYLGLDILSATLFVSDLNSTASAIREANGFLPDSQKPLLRATTGTRFAFAYGKMLIEALDTVIHLDASVALHLGVLITDKEAASGTGVNLGGDVGLSLQAVAYDRLLVWLQGSWWLSYENRTTSNFASGPMGTIGLGILL